MIAPAYMDNQRIGELIRERAETIEDDRPGYWKFEIKEWPVFVITDETHNRMRIMSPVLEIEDLPEDEWKTLMLANFDRALDARYCVDEEYLWSVFIHPLRELSAAQFMDALDQVVSLAHNYGTSYSSTNLIFGDE